MGKPKMWNISKTADRRTKRIIDRRAKRKLWHFEICLNTGHKCSWKFQSAISPTIFIGAHLNVLTTLVTII